MPIMTDARNAVWNAVDNWPALDGVFARTYRFDKDAENVPPEINPHPDELPALALLYDSGLSSQYLNRQYQQQIACLFLLFTDSWALDDPEKYWEILVEALFRSKADGASAPYVQAATGFHPQQDISVDFDKIYLPTNNHKAILTTIGFNLRVNFDPLG